MRVLHVHSGHAWGAVEATLATLARRAELAPAMQPEFALCADGRLRRELENAGAAVIDLGSVQAQAPWSIVRARRELRRLLAGANYDVVVCHSAWTQAVFGGVPRTLGIPEVFYLHDRVHHHRCVERWAARHPPDWSIANSEFTRAGLAGLFAVERSSVVYSPVEPAGAVLSAEERRRVRAELGFDDETVVIVQACRLVPSKGHARLLRALARLPPPTSWFCLQIAAVDGAAERAYRTSLEEQARALGVTARLRFLEDADDASRLFAAADIHCQPNLEPEPFGIAFVRALEAGLPVVTFDMGGPREIVTDEVGVLVTDEAKLAAALERLVGDPELRKRLGAGGPARAHQLCDPAARLPEIAAVLERVTR
ncbi:MAG TPA: glycosyltransferase family 4 protein [Polyangiaceae bacterium]|nr:glycosyltransferase family 4 protein [Polyangiaceae bacterium]